MITTITQRYKWSCHSLSIDLSRAFDTISRQKLLMVLDAIADEDEGQMITLLLADTTLVIQIDTQPNLL